MKKFVFIMAGLVAVSAINAQSLQEIIKKYTAAMKFDNISNVKTITIKGQISAMGAVMPLEMYMKNPDKIRVVNKINSQEIISVFDGEKGFMINPMMGSSEPVEITGDQLEQVKNSNMFRNQLLEFYKKGQLSLEGEENVNGVPAYKLKVTPEASKPIRMYIDKDTGLLIKMTSTIEQNGNSMDLESFMTEYVNIKGVVLPKKTTFKANGMEGGTLSFDSIDVNVPIEDSIFKIK